MLDKNNANMGEVNFQLGFIVGWSGAFIPIMTYETKSVFSETATHAEQNAF